MQRVMGNLDALLVDVHRRAQQHVIGKEAEARQRAEEIVTAAVLEAEGAAEAVHRQGEKEAFALEQRLSAQADLDAMRGSLVARDELVERVFRAAEGRLKERAGTATYPAVLETLALLAARELGAERVMLAADPTGHALLTSERLAGWGRSAGVVFERAAAPADTWGGLLAWHGRERYDVTFPVRLAQARKALREEVFGLLTKGSDENRVGADENRVGADENRVGADENRVEPP